MAKINNQAVMQKLIDQLQLYPAMDTIPTELAEKILPVFQINSDEVTVSLPTTTVVKNQQGKTAASTTIYTTPATGDFYLTAIDLDAYGTSANDQLASITVVIGGATLHLTTLRVSAAEQLKHSTISFNNPILLDKATVIALVNNGDGGVNSSACIYGYTA